MESNAFVAAKDQYSVSDTRVLMKERRDVTACVSSLPGALFGKAVFGHGFRLELSAVPTPPCSRPPPLPA